MYYIINCNYPIIMTIKICELDIIPVYQIEEIINYYNAHRPNDTSPIQQCEGGGGFIIAIKGANPKILPKTQCIKQLKWHKNILVTYIDYFGFSEEEEELLYISMVVVLGEKNVNRFYNYSGALMSSPSYLKMIMG